MHAVGDAERVLQVGRILVENALVHTPAATTVRISTALDGSRATLTVANDGPGIPAEAPSSRCSSGSPGWKAPRPPAAASAWRSGGSWPS